MRKKILLIQPTPYDCKGNLVKKSKLFFVGLALPTLAALTPKEYEVEICLETIEEVPFDTNARIVGISSMGHSVVRSIDLAKEFKRRGKTVIMGGYMVSLMPEEAKKYCDAVLIGDAEEVWGKLLEDIEKEELKSFYRQELKSLNPPLPRFDLIIDKKIGDFLPVQAGRGCPNTCSFCSVYCLYKTKYYKRPIQDVLRDINHVKSLGINKITLLDDNILSDPEYMEELCLEIKKLNIKWMSQCSIEIAKHDRLLKIVADSGCIVLSLGLESISKESLIKMNKAWASPEEYSWLLNKIRGAGIDLSTEMVVGADGDTISSIKRTADFIEANKIVVPRFYILTPIPGTKFHEEMLQQNRIWNHDIYSYNGSEAVHIPANMSPEELTKAYWQLYEEVYSIKGIVKRTLWRLDFFKKPLNYLFYFSVNLFYRYHIKKRITPNII